MGGFGGDGQSDQRRHLGVQMVRDRKGRVAEIFGPTANFPPLGGRSRSRSLDAEAERSGHVGPPYATPEHHPEGTPEPVASHR